MVMDSPFFYPAVAAVVFFLLGWFLFKISFEMRHGRSELASRDLVERAGTSAHV